MNHNKKASSRFCHKHKKLSVFLIVFSVLFVAVLGRFLYEYSIYNDMRSIANQFKPDSTFVNQHDYFVWPSLLCIGDEPCPMYERSWSVHNAVTKAHLTDLLNRSDIQSTLNGTCTPKSGAIGYTSLCETTYTSKGYQVSIAYDTVASDRTKDVIMLRVIKNE